MRFKVSHFNGEPEATRSVKKFLDQSPQASFWTSLEYVGLLREVLDADDVSLVATNSSGEVAGYLPALSRTGTLGTVWNSLPFYGSHGDAIAHSHPAKLAIYDELVASYERAGTASYTLVELSEPPSPIALPGAQFDERLQHRTVFPPSDLPSEQRVFDSVTARTRTAVRKALRQEFVCSVDNAKMPELYRLHAMRMEAIGGTSKPWSFFREVQNHFTDKQYAVWTVRSGPTIAAALLLFYFRDTVEYYTPAIAPGFDSSQALSAGIFAAMTNALNRGFTNWNWGGTWPTQVGVRRFKVGWGAREYGYRYQTMLTRIAEKRCRAMSPTELFAEYPYFYVAPHGICRTDAVSSVAPTDP